MGEKGEGSGGKGGGNWEWGTPLSTPSLRTFRPSSFIFMSIVLNIFSGCSVKRTVLLRQLFSVPAHNIDICSEISFFLYHFLSRGLSNAHLYADQRFGKCSKIPNTNCLPKNLRQRVLLKKQSDQGILCLLF